MFSPVIPSIMARKKSSVLDDLIDIAAHLPWQVGVVLAFIAYLVLHYFATRAPLPANPAELKSLGTSIGESVGHSVTTTLAMFLQYIVPACLLVGAVVSFIRRRRQSALHVQVAADRSSNALEKMTWREFEGLVAETFRQQGYRVVERGGNGPDGGVDLELYQGTDKYLVQCKQWKSSKVGVAIVRELFGLMSAEHAVGGFVVASGEFTQEAKAFAEGRSIRLVDARKLRVLMPLMLPRRLRRHQNHLARPDQCPMPHQRAQNAVAPWCNASPRVEPTQAKRSGDARRFLPAEAFDPSGAASVRRSLAEFPHSLGYLHGSRNRLEITTGPKCHNMACRHHDHFTRQRIAPRTFYLASRFERTKT